MMKREQAGFTLIELVMVIVILGILAATALPKYLDLQSDAGKAAAEGVLGAANSAAAIHFAKQLTTGSAYQITTAAALLSAMDPHPGDCLATNDTTITCTFGGTPYAITVAPATVDAPAKLSKGW